MNFGRLMSGVEKEYTMNRGTRLVLATVFLWFAIGSVTTILAPADGLIQSITFVGSLLLAVILVYRFRDADALRPS